VLVKRQSKRQKKPQDENIGLARRYENNMDVDGNHHDNAVGP
jgi:hypothetical protein